MSFALNLALKRSQRLKMTTNSSVMAVKVRLNDLATIYGVAYEWIYSQPCGTQRGS